MTTTAHEPRRTAPRFSRTRLAAAVLGVALGVGLAAPVQAVTVTWPDGILPHLPADMAARVQTTETAVVDVLFEDNGAGPTGIQTAFEVAQQAFRDSRTYVVLRNLGTVAPLADGEQVFGATKVVINGVVLGESGGMKKADIRQLANGADVRASLRPMTLEDVECGLSHVNARKITNINGGTDAARPPFVTVQIGEASNGTVTKKCGATSFAHETGHSLFDLAHDIGNWPAYYGTPLTSYGYGQIVAGDYGDVMSYARNDATVFSSPETRCGGLVCGSETANTARQIRELRFVAQNATIPHAARLDLTTNSTGVSYGDLLVYDFAVGNDHYSGLLKPARDTKGNLTGFTLDLATGLWAHAPLVLPGNPYKGETQAELVGNELYIPRLAVRTDAMSAMTGMVEKYKREDALHVYLGVQVQGGIVKLSINSIGKRRH